MLALRAWRGPYRGGDTLSPAALVVVRAVVRGTEWGEERRGGDWKEGREEGRGEGSGMVATGSVEWRRKVKGVEYKEEEEVREKWEEEKGEGT